MYSCPLCGCDMPGIDIDTLYSSLLWLDHMLNSHGLRITDVANLAGCSRTTICNWKAKFSMVAERNYFPPNRCPNDVANKIVQAYKDGVSAKDAAEQYGYTEGVCYRILKERDIDNRGHYSPPSVPIIDQEKIVTLYNNGHSYNEIAKTTGYGPMTCWKYVQVANVKSRFRYSVDETIFDEIDTKEKAYWLGFIYADGNIHDNNLTINLSARDIEHIRKFRKFMSSEHPIHEREIIAFDKPAREARIKIGSIKLCASLAKWGVFPAKSLILKPPIGLSDQLEPHFWRGMIDGDGCIRYDVRSNSNGSWGIHLVSGSRDIIEGFLGFVRKYVETKAKIESRDKHTFSIRFGGNVIVQDILPVLYKDATVYLDRKYELYKQCMATPRTHYRFGEEQIKELVADETLSLEEIAERLNTDREVIKRHCAKYGIEVDWWDRAVKRRRADFDMDEAIELYEGGLSLRKVAKAVDISHPILAKRFREHGVEIRSR